MSGERLADARLVVQILARDDERQPIVDLMQLFAGDAVGVEQRQQLVGGARRLEHQHVALAGDADDRGRQARRIGPHNRAVG